MNNSDKFRANPQSGRAVEPVAYVGGGFMGDNDYYNNLGDNRNKPKNKGNHSFQDLPRQPEERPSVTPQDFADQKKDKAKTAISRGSKFNSEDYLAANKDVADWWNDGSQQGTFSGSGAVSEKYGVNTNTWEKTWVDDMNKAYGTSHTDMNQFTRDQYARHHYKAHGMNEGRNTYVAAQSPTQPETPSPTPSEPPSDTQNPVTRPEPSNYEQFKNRFAASDQFKNELNQAKNLGQQQGSSSAPQQYNNSSSSSNATGIDNNQGLNRGRQRVDNMLNSSQGFSTQLGREANMRNSSPNTQDSTDFVKKYSLLNDDMQRDRGNPFDIANQAVSNAAANSQLDLKALDRNIRKTPLYSGARSELFGLQVFGDKYRNARENPVSWRRPDAANPVESPDFMGIYDRTKEDLDSIKI